MMEESNSSLFNADNGELSTILHSIKKIIYDLSSKMITQTEADIDEALRIDEIKKQLTEDPNNLNMRLTLMIDTIAKICSPARDIQVEELRAIKSPTIEFLKKLILVLDDMRIDMCNFLLAQHRKKIIEHAVNFEWNIFLSYREKISELALPRTIAWLKNATQTAQFNQIISKSCAYSDYESQQIVEYGYKSLIFLDETDYPETVMLDINRINFISSLFTASVFVASLLNILKKHILRLKKFDEMIDTKIVHISFTLKKDEMTDETKMKKMAQQILEFLEIELLKYQLQPLSTEYKTFFVSKMIQLVHTTDPVWKLFENRISAAIFSDDGDVLPTDCLHPSIQALSDAIFRIRDIFRRFTKFNQMTYLKIYRVLLLELLTLN
ncbi:hypothetical protein MXB_5297 [Myxobolus squamalis]|nr:hypothetical protein MXB_5297 [Myxobolus squamalis]